MISVQYRRACSGLETVGAQVVLGREVELGIVELVDDLGERPVLELGVTYHIISGAQDSLGPLT